MTILTSDNLLLPSVNRLPNLTRTGVQYCKPNDKLPRVLPRCYPG